MKKKKQRKMYWPKQREYMACEVEFKKTEPNGKVLKRIRTWPNVNDANAYLAQLRAEVVAGNDFLDGWEVYKVTMISKSKGKAEARKCTFPNRPKTESPLVVEPSPIFDDLDDLDTLDDGF